MSRVVFANIVVGDLNAMSKPDAVAERVNDPAFVADADTLMEAFKEHLGQPKGFPMVVGFGDYPPYRVDWEPFAGSGLLWIDRKNIVQTVSTILAPECPNEVVLLGRLQQLMDLFAPHLKKDDEVIKKRHRPARPMVVTLCCVNDGRIDVGVETAVSSFAAAFLAMKNALGPQRGNC